MIDLFLLTLFIIAGVFLCVIRSHVNDSYERIFNYSLYMIVLYQINDNCKKELQTLYIVINHEPVWWPFDINISFKLLTINIKTKLIKCWIIIIQELHVKHCTEMRYHCLLIHDKCCAYSHMTLMHDYWIIHLVIDYWTKHSN